MNARTDLGARRDILLIGLHARRLGFARRRDAVLTINHDPGYPRSAVMRFVFRQPHICLWAISEVIPLLSGRGRRGSLKRFTEACYADFHPVANQW